MNGNYRGGNGRLLVKQLDLSAWPIAWLQSRGEIVFINKAMCEAAQVEAAELVGLKCSWELPADASAFRELLLAIAPPQAVLNGNMVTRQISWPPVAPTGQIAQYFVPIAGSGENDRNFLVLHAVDQGLSSTPIDVPAKSRVSQATDWLMRFRSQWIHLDGLLPMLGTSPAIQFAMKRVQLAIASQADLFLWGAKGVGKLDVLRAIFVARLKNLGLPLAAGRFFPIDCATLDESLCGDMLEVFQSLLSPDSPSEAHQLVLERIDQAEASVVGRIQHWLAEIEPRCCLAATSRTSVSELSARGDIWSTLASRIGILEIELPSLAARREDISILLHQVLAAVASRQQRAPPVISSAALDLLTAYDWPENVAELQKFSQDILGQLVHSNSIQPNHLPLAIRTFGGTVLGGLQAFDPIDLDQVLLEVERTMIGRALKLSPRNRAQAARWLGISRPRLLRRIVELGLADLPEADQHDEH